MERGNIAVAHDLVLLLTILPNKSGMMRASEFTLLTWNVWFEELAYQERLSCIFDTVKKLSPDMICFQEVLKPRGNSGAVRPEVWI